MTFAEAMDHLLAGNIVTDGELLYRLGAPIGAPNGVEFVEHKDGYLDWKIGMCLTRRELESTRWRLVPQTPEKTPEHEPEEPETTNERNEP